MHTQPWWENRGKIMARFHVTFVFERADITTAEDALSYARELANEEMLNTGELVEAHDAEIID